MTGEIKKIVYKSGFLKWFICGCESKTVYIVEKEEVQVVKPKLEKSDDLTVIEGIGPVISRLLKRNGIRTYTELGSAKVDTLRKILDKKGLNYHEPKTWPQQSKLARDKKWKELEKLQDELVGGRKK